MFKIIRNTLVLSVLATAVAVMPLHLRAQNTNKPSAVKPPAAKPPASGQKEPAVKKARSIPFHGNLKALDKTAKTFSVDKRILQITSETKILRAEKPATFESGVLGEYVTGSYNKTDDGKLLARSVYFGGKNKTKPPETKEK